jgi:hypothetical protein
MRFERTTESVGTMMPIEIASSRAAGWHILANGCAKPSHLEAEQEHCWAVLALALDDLRLTEQEYMQVCG